MAVATKMFRSSRFGARVATITSPMLSPSELAKDIGSFASGESASAGLSDITAECPPALDGRDTVLADPRVVYEFV